MGTGHDVRGIFQLVFTQLIVNQIRFFLSYKLNALHEIFLLDDTVAN